MIAICIKQGGHLLFCWIVNYSESITSVNSPKKKNNPSSVEMSKSFHKTPKILQAETL